jgi:hypothetical protein
VTTVFLILIGLVALAAWWLHSRLYPWAKCRRCDGAGKVNRLTNRAGTWAECPRCHGDKKVRRLLARKDR